VIGRAPARWFGSGTYDVTRVSTKGVVSLRDAEGRTIRFSPDRLDPNDKRDQLALSERETCASMKAIASAGLPMTRRVACSIPPRRELSPSHVRVWRCGQVRV
jgi:hypothetical protein